MIHGDTISPKMHEIGRVVYARLDRDYYLAGGTALSLRIGHRESIDLDYFIAKHIDTVQLKGTLSELFPGIIFTYEDVDTLWCTFDGIKVSFISRLAPMLESVLDEGGFRIASLQDLVVMKLSAVCGRDEYKDYYDLAELATLTDGRTWPALWRKVYGESDPIAWIVALSHVGSVAPIPLRGKSLRENSKVEKSIHALVKELSTFV
jgi:hypothetical protein